MSTWSDLEEELERWRALEITPKFWWRDDDAHAATSQLEPLLALSEKYSVPVHLAVIPAKLQPDLADRLKHCKDVLTMQHGFAHINHAPKGNGASEFGDQRPSKAQAQDLTDGWQILEQAQLPNLVPAFVPPWNRMAKATLAQLHGLGYRVVSAYEGHTPDVPMPGIIRANGHIDPIRWKKGRQFRGASGMLDLITSHLVARREGKRDMAEPIGFLTHHLETGKDIWAFTDELFLRLARQKGSRWIHLPSLIAPE